MGGTREECKKAGENAVKKAGYEWNNGRWTNTINMSTNQKTDKIENQVEVIIWNAFSKALKEGKSENEAMDIAISEVKRAGYYKKGGKWYKAKKGQRVI